MITRVIFYLTALFCIFPCAGYAINLNHAQPCFVSQTEACLKKVASYIAHAKKSIYILTHTFESNLLGRSLAIAKNRGIDVDVIIDNDKIQNKKSILTLLQRSKINYRIINKTVDSHFIIIDDFRIILGLPPFLQRVQNGDILFIEREPQLIKSYTQFFLEYKADKNIMQDVSPLKGPFNFPPKKQTDLEKSDSLRIQR